MSTAGVVIIGNEVLSGKVEEANAGFLIRELRGLGISLRRLVMIRDDVGIIAREVADMAQRFRYVLTTGGIGLTHDDVTFAGLAAAFDLPLEDHPELMAGLERRYGEHMNEALRQMARLPKGAVLISTGDGTFPLVQVRNVFAFPGVPSFLRSKFAALKPHLAGQPVFLREIFLNVREHLIAALLEETQRAFEGVEVGSYPRFDTDEYRVRVTLEGPSDDRVESAYRRLVEGLEPSWVVAGPGRSN